jgi:glycosyltransferase involved in cell wall biosynthesis
MAFTVPGDAKWLPVYILTFLTVFSLILVARTPTTRSRVVFPYSFVSTNYKPKPVAEEDKKTITWIVHMYPPLNNAGAEWMAHCMNRYLIEKAGYKVNVIVPSFPVREFEGVNIMVFDQKAKIEHAIRHSSVIISHLGFSNHAVMTGEAAKRPVILVMHNHEQEEYLQKYMQDISVGNLHIVNNSLWIKNLYDHFRFNSIVVYPPVNWKDYRTPESDKRVYVTLINLNRNKGGDVLIQIAKRMPDVQFLGVEGGYDTQIKDTSVKNIRYMKNTPKIQEIYSITKILLVPSQEESWGRVAVEAMSSGIPVIANPTPGLKEACGSAGFYASRVNISEWISAINQLLSNPVLYKKAGAASFARARQLEPDPQLGKFSLWLEDIQWQERGR